MILNKDLHIVSFDVPYPPNYGGVIDVFYKLKALFDLGINIHLHSYEYGKGKQKELEKYCKSVTYYKRSKSPLNLLSSKPFIVKSRSDAKLIKNLIKDDYPIIFEGLHTTFPLNDFDFKDRLTIVRTHNIEHKYYKGLAKSEKQLARKSFFKQESQKLKNYEQILYKADFILSISPFEHLYFKNKFGKKVVYIPVFHKNNEVKKLSKNGKFALYHGDLRVSDNIKACNFLIEVFKTLDYSLIIASSYPNKEIKNKIKNHSNITFDNLSNKNQLDKLFSEAHINVLPTFQKTGIKLKLIYALFQSRFCLVNDAMVQDTGLENLCQIANSIDEFRKKIKIYSHKKFSDVDYNIRKEILEQFNNISNAKKIVTLLTSKN